MFAQDDRDRFGDQIFPVVPKLKVPVPGSYDSHGSIEEKTKNQQQFNNNVSFWRNGLITDD